MFDKTIINSVVITDQQVKALGRLIHAMHRESSAQAEAELRGAMVDREGRDAATAELRLAIEQAAELFPEDGQ